MSVAIIAFEVTGHVTTILPIIIAVVTANSVAFFLSLSLHDTIMLIKGLPYLPNLMTCGSTVDNIYVDEFMIKEVKFIWNNISYHDLQHVLAENQRLDQFPLVDDKDNMYLLGSIEREELMSLLKKQIGCDRLKRKTGAVHCLFQHSSDCVHHFGSSMVQLRPPMFNKNNMHLTPLQRSIWRKERLKKCIDFHTAGAVIDPAPFQLVESSTLLSCHSLFVMVGIHIAYVTNIGELVGVVGLKEVSNTPQKHVF